MYKVDIQGNNAFCTNPETNEIYKLELIKSHIEFGNIYVFSNILNMPYMRKGMFDLITQYESIGIDKKEVLMATQKAMNMIKDKADLNDIYTEFANLNTRIRDVWDYQKTAIAIVGLLMVKECDLDKIGYYDKEIAESNINQWSKDTAIFDFFLSIAQQKINNFWNTLDIDTASYFQPVTEQTISKPTKKKSNFLDKIKKTFRT